VKYASIVAVGTELLFGQTINTNAAYISQRLHELGIGVVEHFVVGDNAERFKRVLEDAFREADIVITTGGLGPTQDDLTKETLAEFMGVPLVFDAEAEQRMQQIFRELGAATYTENNKKQTFLPEGAVIFYNNAGTAPGFALEKNGKIVLALPGPPREMKRMFSESAEPYLAGLSNSVIFSKTLRFYGIGESALETLLLPIIDGQSDPTVASYAKEGECAVRISSARASEAEARAAVEQAICRARELAGKYIFSEDDEEYIEVVYKLLRERGLKLAAAESCTGGLFAGAITSIAGSSEVFDRGFVTYSNEAKMAQLGVDRETLERYGAVSEQCCREMAMGALKNSDADVAVAVTGISGPTGETCGKPIGTGFYGIAFYEGDKSEAVREIKAEVRERNFRDRGREVNRRASVLELCDLICKTICHCEE